MGTGDIPDNHDRFPSSSLGAGPFRILYVRTGPGPGH